MPQDVLEVTTRFMREPIRILVKKEELTLEGIRQFYVEVEREVCKINVHCTQRSLFRNTCSLLSLLHYDQMRLFSGMETGYAVRLVRDPYHHSGCDLLQYTQEGRLAHREDARSSLHRVRYGKYTIATLRFKKDLFNANERSSHRNANELKSVLGGQRWKEINHDELFGWGDCFDHNNFLNLVLHTCSSQS